MYAASIVEQRIIISRQELGFTLEYHSPSDIAEFNSLLESRYPDIYAAARAAATGVEDSTKTFRIHMQRSLANPQSPVLSRDEVRFIQNERALIMCDAAYFLTRYYWVFDEQNIRKLYKFRAGQRILFDVIAEMENRGIAIEIILAKARQLGMCLDPETPILTHDLKWVKLDEIAVGQKLVATEETSSRRSHRCLKSAVVEAKREVYEEAFLIEMSNGAELIATAQHRFLSRIGTSTVWTKVEDMKSGDEIRHITDHWKDPTYEDGWMGGLLDGEGSLRQKNRAGAELCVAQVAGPVLERAREYLTKRGYSFRVEADNRKAGSSSKLGSQVVYKFVISRLNEIFKLIGHTRPSRLVTKDWWEWKELPGKRVGGGWHQIKSITSLGKRRMIDLQTSAGTFIANGFVSHNSTISAGLEMLKVMFSSGTSGIIASADTGKTREMVSKIFMAYDSLPWWLPPLTTKRVESENGLIVFAGDSRLVFQHGKQTNPIAMGSTPITYHLSEVSSYPNPEALIEIGLFKCVHPSPRVLGILESTCKGDTGWWFDTYWNSKKNWATGGSRLMALFLPFYCDTDLYPNPTWLRKSPVPSNWKPEVDTRKMIAESELYVRSNPVLDKVLRAKQGGSARWIMEREQAWYWEQNFKEHRAKGAEKTWYQEMPHTDDVAFQGSYDNVFGKEIVAEAFSDRPTAYAVYAICGQSIEDRHDPDREELDLEEQIIPVSYTNMTDRTYRWELWPLLWKEPFRELSDIRDDRSHMGKLFVWHPPEPGFDYSIGVDTSNGIGLDATVISVARRGRTPQEQDIQAAEFRSDEVSHVEAFAWVMAIAAYYARYMDPATTGYKEPYVAIEQIAAVGDTCQHQMGKMGYKRFHKMIRYDVTAKNKRKSKANKVGWFTSSWSRPMLTDGFVTMVKNGWYKVNSPYTLREMTQWEVHYTSTGKDKYEHAVQCTDDGIFANAMCAFCPNDVRTMADRSSRQFNSIGRSGLPELDLNTYSGIVVSADADHSYYRQ